VTEEEQQIILQKQLDNICKILDADLQYSLLLDHKGVEKRRISITYQEKGNESMDL
tara:strand:- start:5652 stop:5819 length:168 start_codon:yes stop_codon:yes gene_type:complete